MNDKEFYSEFGWRIQKIATILRRSGDRLLIEKVGINRTQFLLLSAIEAQDDARTIQQRLADHLGVTKGAISRQIQLATAASLVASNPNHHDLRSKNLMLTRKGKQALHQSRLAIADAEGLFTTRLSASTLQRLNNDLDKIIDALDDSSTAMNITV